MSALRSLAISKIHCVDSTAKGEIAYARYVYQHTLPDDKTVRAPIASFWAARSHTLRSEAEAEFKALCLEFPQFGYDILSKSLPLLASQCATPLTVPNSPRARREAQARARREDAPFVRRRLRAQARPPQQRRRRIGGSPTRARSRGPRGSVTLCTFGTWSGKGGRAYCGPGMWSCARVGIWSIRAVSVIAGISGPRV